jgi:N-glycosidase YbiA
MNLNKKIISYNKVNEPYGWLSNMSAYPIQFDSKIWRTNEALFQAMRFEDAAIREIIRMEKSPMGAKMKSKANKKNYSITPMSELDLNNMRTCIELKLEQHPNLINMLIATEDYELIENIGKRNGVNHLFWGKKNVNGDWIGLNTMGKIWMEFRENLRKKSSK